MNTFSIISFLMSSNWFWEWWWIGKDLTSNCLLQTLDTKVYPLNMYRYLKLAFLRNNRSHINKMTPISLEDNWKGPSYSLAEKLISLKILVTLFSLCTHCLFVDHKSDSISLFLSNAHMILCSLWGLGITRMYTCDNCLTIVVHTCFILPCDLLLRVLTGRIYLDNSKSSFCVECQSCLHIAGDLQQCTPCA